MKSLLLFLSFSSAALAQDVVEVQKGASAPFTGLLFPAEKAREIQIRLIEADGLERRLAIKDKLIESLDTENISLYESQKRLHTELQRVYKQADSNSNRSMWRDFGSFTLGVITTIAITFAVNQASK